MVGFEGHTVLDLGAEHHLGAIHEVVHAVFKGWNKGDRIYQVEEDFGVSCDLNPFVSFDKVHKTTLLDIKILLPAHLFGEGVSLLLEKENLTGASGNQSLIVDEEHLPQVLVKYFLLDIGLFH